MLAACTSGGGGGGGLSSDARGCTLYANGTFQDDATLITPVDPKRQCPYTVAAVGSLVPFAFFIDIPAANIFSGSHAHLQVQDHSGVWRLDNYAYFSSVDPHDNSKLRATTSGSYQGGHAGTDGKILDGVVIQYYSIRAGTDAIGDLYIPGNVDPNHVNLIAPTDIEIGQTNTFRLMPGWDTVSYEYAWDINGRSIGSTASVSASVGSLGYFTVRGIAIRSGDYSADTATRTYSTYLHGVTISGQSQAQTGCPGYWYANPIGGLAPYTYVWSVGGTSYDTGSSNELDYVPTSSGSLTIQVTVTDSNANTVSNSTVVSVTSGYCT